jgi:hypothetical protein
MKYSAFIDVPKSLAFQLDFLSRAVSTDETRYTMNYINIISGEKGLLGVASDGRRAHLAEPLDKAADILGITPGYWRVIKKTAKTMFIARLDDSETKDWNYPNWRKVIPSEKAVYETTFEGFSLERKRAYPHSLEKLFRNFPEATFIDLKYLLSLGTGVDWRVEWRGAEKAIKFTADNLLAVIMPMQGG